MHTFRFSIWSEFSGTRAKAIFHRSGTRGSGYFGQLLSAVAATPKTHLHARVSSGRDSACSYLAALSAPNKCKAARAWRNQSYPRNYLNLGIFITVFLGTPLN